MVLSAANGRKGQGRRVNLQQMILNNSLIRKSGSNVQSASATVAALSI